MPTIPEARTEVQREVQELVALVGCPSQQTATEAEIALWSGVLRLGMSLMTLFFAHQAARWPTGLRYEVDGVRHEVEGADTVEIGTKFGKISVLQPMGRRAGRPPVSSRHADGARTRTARRIHVAVGGLGG